ncbi:MAG: glycoprotein endopeptidase metalloprotease [Planctomycetota bacterium]|nr:MAG: glycoprotein endopeptidase metalloprotease [Planctomycetota bacterium]
MSSDTLRVERETLADGSVQLRLAGELRLDASHDLRARLDALRPDPAAPLQIDLSELENLDGAGAALLHAYAHACEDSGARPRISGARDGVATILELYEPRGKRPCERPPPQRLSTVEHVGNTSWELWLRTRDALDFLGNFALACLAALRRPRSVHWADLGKLCERVGADAVPIVALIAFLIGLVTAFQSAETFKQYGANIFVADMVGLSMTRVMGPLMMAILVAGRSGAGFAAELGTMKVSEEIDALRTLGLDPLSFLVIPRVVALVLMVPLLTLLADLLGIVGGLLIGMSVLDLTLTSFLNRLSLALDLWDVGTGLILSVAYGVAIGVIACERGLATSGGAVGVGRNTTSAVVTILFNLVLITSVLTILFQMWGI